MEFTPGLENPRSPSFPDRTGIGYTRKNGIPAFAVMSPQMLFLVVI